MNVIDSKSLEREAGGKPVPTFPHPAQDHDDFGLIQSKIMNVIDSKSLEREAGCQIYCVGGVLDVKLQIAYATTPMTIVLAICKAFGFSKM